MKNGQKVKRLSVSPLWQIIVDPVFVQQHVYLTYVGCIK